MIYKPKLIAGNLFGEKALYNLDCQKWEREARARVARMRVEFSQTGKILQINLRPRPTFGGQTTFWGSYYPKRD